MFVLVFYTFFCTLPVYAELESPNYRIEESAIGTSDMSNSSSSGYQTTNATGALSIGNASSSGYQIDTGTKTSPDPALSFSLDDGAANFGSFSATSATVATATFSISNYTSYGYVAQITGTPPTNSDHTITAMSETDISRPGTEQFGINLVANTLPTNVGANPDNGQFGFGEVSPNYATPNNFRYVSGETIALAPKSSGKTTYTVSYLINVNGITPGGIYTCDQTIIIIGTY